MKKIILLWLATVTLVLWWCFLNNDNNWKMTNNTNNDLVKVWDTIKVDYVWKFEDWSVFDTSIESVAKESNLYSSGRKYEPLEFTVWSWMMIKWFDAWVVWMKHWETKNVKIPAADAYWEIKKEYVQSVPANVFSWAWIQPVVWESYNFGSSMWKVVEISWENIIIDFNHPMAWKTLVFDITVK